jgi:hypothetical protein
MLDFSRIIGGVAGQREAFEDLVCALGRRLPPTADANFQRIHGAGGDGGVEAVWVLPDGSEHGFQAKFHLKTQDIDWGAIDGSVSTALKIHPKLTKYYIAIATDLTGPTGRKGKTGWERWDEHRAKWSVEATQVAGHDVEFIPWMASDLEDLLKRPEMRGLAEYWLAELDVSDGWVRSQYDRTIAALEERYHPEDHVEVLASGIFDGFARSPNWRAVLEKAARGLAQETPTANLPAQFSTESTKLIGEIRALTAEQKRAGPDVHLPPAEHFPTKTWAERAAKILDVTFRARERLQEDREEYKVKREAELAAEKSTKDYEGFGPPKADTSQFDSVLEQLRKLNGAARTLAELLDSAAKRADDRRFLFLDGRAGSGKSHFLASEVAKRIDQGAVCLFVLGTDFTQVAPLERQLEAHLGLPPATFDRFLAALDARADAVGDRGLIVIDAINEGAGAELWRQKLKAFVAKVLTYPNLGLCLSCRTEYVDYLLTEQVKAIAALGTIAGFQTFEEQEQAARVYMDKRGIVRPAAPRLDPEFSNPLFLRTACNALQAEGNHQFPLGLRGTKRILDFFLTATARHLGTSYDGSNDLVAPTQQALLGLADWMAKARQDYAERSDAARIIDAAFRSFAAPPGRTWLDLLQKRGLLRYDPNPANDPAKTLALQPEVVRLSFQRFQDHLVVEALLAPVHSTDALFAKGEPFAFLLDGEDVRWQWRGLFQALYIQVADRWGVELADVLPWKFETAWDDWFIQDAFVQSVRFRGQHAFSPRSRELLTAINRHNADFVALILELSVIEGHPLNASFLHPLLKRMKLADRDANWTLAINEAQQDPAHPFNSIVDWSLGDGICHATDEVLGLAGLVLGWGCTSTSLVLRDRASKALTSIFIERPAVAASTIEAFADCNDPYVSERLWAAAYGACLRDPEPTRLSLFADLAWTHVFEPGAPPALLLRDYSRAIVELAESKGVLHSNVQINRCRPPYGSKAPRLEVDQDKLEKRAERLGAEAILYSCYKGLADFGRYTLEGRVEKFSKASLKRAKPIARRTLFETFEADLEKDNPEASLKLQTLRSAYALSVLTEWDDERLVVKAIRKQAGRIQSLEEDFLGTLSSAEARRYRRQAEPYLSGGRSDEFVVSGSRQIGKIDATAAKLWVANRALSLGWTKKRFPLDRSVERSWSEGPKIERIGKKYQRIALSELLARLADNYWLAPDWSETAKAYDNSLDVEFVRDLEPSVLPTQLTKTPFPLVPPLNISPVPEAEHHTWTHEPGLCEERLGRAVCEDLQETGWVALYRYGSADIKADHERPFGHSQKQTEFYFIQALLVPAQQRAEFVAEAEFNSADFHEWLPSEEIDGAFVGELGLRDIWPDLEPVEINLAERRSTERTFHCVRPASLYRWESHLDRSLPDGVSLALPSARLLRELSLRADREMLGSYSSADGSPAVRSSYQEKNSNLLIRRDLLETYAASRQLAVVWTVIGERIAWRRNESPQGGSRSRYNGMLWYENGEAKKACWARSD